MEYRIYFVNDAKVSLLRLSPEVARRIVRKIEHLRHDLAADVKRLKAFVPNYRLRVGDWRVLFDVQGDEIIIS